MFASGWKVSFGTTMSVALISRPLKSPGAAAGLLELDAGGADEGDAADVDADDPDDAGLADLSLPHPVTAAPTTKPPAARRTAHRRYVHHQRAPMELLTFSRNIADLPAPLDIVHADFATAASPAAGNRSHAFAGRSPTTIPAGSGGA